MDINNDIMHSILLFCDLETIFSLDTIYDLSYHDKFIDTVVKKNMMIVVQT